MAKPYTAYSSEVANRISRYSIPVAAIVTTVTTVTTVTVTLLGFGGIQAI